MKAPKHATTNYKRLVPFLNAVDASEDKHIRLELSGYEPLVFEYLYEDYRGRPVYSMTHYYEQNGDLMCDPDMTIAVDREAGEAWPRSYQMDALGVYQQVFKRQADGKMTYSPSLLRELDGFLWHWLRNVEEQGFRAEA